MLKERLPFCCRHTRDLDGAGAVSETVVGDKALLCKLEDVKRRRHEEAEIPLGELSDFSVFGWLMTAEKQAESKALVVAVYKAANGGRWSRSLPRRTVRPTFPLLRKGVEEDGYVSRRRGLATLRGWCVSARGEPQLGLDRGEKNRAGNGRAMT